MGFYEVIHMDIGYKENAIKVIEKVLWSIHNKEYRSIVNDVDENEIEDMDSFAHFVQGTLELNGYDSIDEYGVPCNFHPKYEYSQMSFYEYDDNSGFAVDYDLTSSSELVDMCLQMKFLYTADGGMKSIFVGIDPR